MLLLRPAKPTNPKYLSHGLCTEKLAIAERRAQSLRVGKRPRHTSAGKLVKLAGPGKEWRGRRGAEPAHRRRPVRATTAKRPQDFVCRHSGGAAVAPLRTAPTCGARRWGRWPEPGLPSVRRRSPGRRRLRLRWTDCPRR